MKIASEPTPLRNTANVAVTDLLTMRTTPLKSVKIARRMSGKIIIKNHQQTTNQKEYDYE